MIIISMALQDPKSPSGPSHLTLADAMRAAMEIMFNAFILNAYKHHVCFLDIIIT